MSIELAIKIDVDTDRGTRIGVPNLLRAFDEFDVKAAFLFSLGPDNTGRAIKRIFRPGFFRKVTRTSVVSTYGVRTLLNGVLLPGPHIGRRNENVMRAARDAGHEVGIHCYDHIRWQDGTKWRANSAKHGASLSGSSVRQRVPRGRPVGRRTRLVLKPTTKRSSTMPAMPAVPARFFRGLGAACFVRYKFRPHFPRLMSCSADRNIRSIGWSNDTYPGYEPID